MTHIAEEIIPIVAIGGGILVAIVAIVCGTVFNIYKLHRQTNLKQMMLEAGVTPHDIERVINCGSEPAKHDHPVKQKSASY